MIRVKVLSKVKPELLKRKKEVTWDEIIDSGNWNTLINHIIEMYAYDFGWKTISEKLKFLRDKIGIKIDTNNDEEILLSDAENVRNIIVHNGGKVSLEFITRTGRTDLQIGDMYIVTIEFWDKVSQLVDYIANQLYLIVLAKFFDYPLPGD